MAQNRLAHFEEILAFLLEQGAHERRRIERVGLLVADEQVQASSVLEGARHMCEVVLQRLERDAFFVKIYAFGAGREAAHQRQIAAVAAHDLDHEAAARRDRRVLDLVDHLDDAVERGVGADAQLGAGQVVADRGRQADDRDVEGRELSPTLLQLQSRLVCRPASDQQQAIDLERLERVRDRGEIITRRHRPTGAEVGSAHRAPAVDVHPRELLSLAADQAFEAVADRDRRVPTIDGEPHGGTDRGVHAGRRRAGRQDAEAQPALPGLRRARHRLDQSPQRAELLLEAPAAQVHGLLVVVSGDGRRDRARLLDALHQRQMRDAVVAQADDLRLILGLAGEQMLDGSVPEERAHPPVERARRAAALNVAQDRDAHLFVQVRFEHLSHALARDRVAVAVARAFGDDDRAVPPTGRAARRQHPTHLVLPVVGIRRVLGEENPVSGAGQRRHQRQVAAVPAHDLDHERALMARGGAADLVERCGDPVQGGVGPDRHVGAGEVVVDRTHQPDDRQLRMPRSGLGRDDTLCCEFRDQAGPLLSEEIGAGQAAVAAAHHEAIDAALEQMARRLEPPLAGAERGAARRADDRAAVLHDPADALPGHAADPVGAVDHALVALEDREDVDATADGGAHDGAQRRIHPRRVAAAGQDADRAPCVLVEHAVSPASRLAARLY